MEQAVRRNACAGVALAGASLIAITPVTGPSLESQTRAVQLMSTASALDVGDAAMQSDTPYPIVTPAELFSDTQTNLQALEQQIAANPTPILDQVLANQTLYGQELATAAQNAQNDLVSAVQGFPAELQQAATSGDLYTELEGIESYVLGSAVQVNHDLLNGTSEVVQQVVNNLDNVVTDTGAIAYNVVDEQNFVPIWLSELVQAGLYPDNAAFAGLAGVADDIQTAFNAGDYSTALSDLANAPSTVLDAFLNGYQVASPVGPLPGDGGIAPVGGLFGVPPEFGLLTGAESATAQPTAQSESDLAIALVGRGTIENELLAREDIARDLNPERAFADVLSVHSAASTDLLSGASGTDGLGTLVGDLSNAVNPTAWLSDLTALFDPSAATDVGTSVSTDLSSALLGAF